MQVAGVWTVGASVSATRASAAGGQSQSEDARERETACPAHAASRRDVAEVLSEVHRTCSPYPKRTINERYRRASCLNQHVRGLGGVQACACLHAVYH